MNNITSTKDLLIIVTLLIVVVASATASIFLKYQPLLILFIPIIAYCIYTIRHIYKNTIEKIAFMFDSIDADDYAFGFNDRRANISEKMLNSSLSRIRDIMRRTKNIAIEREKYYELIMNSVKTAVITINDNGNVYQANNEAKKLFGINSFMHINQLIHIAPNIKEILFNLKEGKHTLLSYTNEVGEVSLLLNASEIILDGKRLKVISANDINNNLDEKEVESWSKLIRVLTHEIMNSLSPITTLSEALIDINRDKGGDVEKGLTVINTTSKRLVKFVESYRKFTRIHITDRYPTEIKAILEKSLQLVTDDSVEFKLDVTTEDTIVNIDEKLILQMVINIFKNAIEGMVNIEDKHIEIDLHINHQDQVVVKVSNNGDEIPLEIVDDIFTPFFTTKPTGSGVGLSIARQIMHLHGGEIKLTSNKKGCVTFLIIFT